MAASKSDEYAKYLWAGAGVLAASVVGYLGYKWWSACGKADEKKGSGKSKGKYTLEKAHAKLDIVTPRTAEHARQEPAPSLNLLDLPKRLDETWNRVATSQRI